MAEGTPARARPWWVDAVTYQIYPRSFCDSDGDGVGDLEGIRRRLDHLAWLGIDAIWLSPFFRSPMADFGYDVSDYCDVDPLFGDLAGFDTLLAEAHERGLRVVIDWVPNHSSDQHPWFVAARSSRTDEHRDFYHWRDPDPEDPTKPPNNWIAAFAPVPAWTFDAGSGQWYLHLFLPEQPDLNWGNPAVAAAMQDTLRFWLDRGVDGFRMDVIHAIGKDPSLPDLPAESAAIPACAQIDGPNTHGHLRELRTLLDSYQGDRMMVGEVFLLDTALVAPYYGTPEHPELHLSFNFPPLRSPWEARVWRRRVDQTMAELGPRDAWPTWVLSNHDNPRHRTRYGSEARARAAAVLLLGLPGAPYVYAGEELGLRDAVVPPDRIVDPGGRDGCRAPIPWDDSPAHGWASADPWLPWPPGVDAGIDAETQAADPDSMLHLYRRILAARKASAALRHGSFRWLETPEGVLGWERHDAATGDRRSVLVNFTDAAVEVAVTHTATIEVSTHSTAAAGSPFSGALSPDEAVITR